MLLYLTTFLTSFCTMAYAMLISSIVSDFTGEEIFSQCFTTGAYLLGLGGGSYFGDKIKDEKSYNFLWTLEWLSFLLLPLIPILFLCFIYFYIQLTPPDFGLDSKKSLLIILTTSSCFSLATGLLGGAQLPLLLKLSYKKIKAEVVFALNYMGPLITGPFIIFINNNGFDNSKQAGLIGIIQFIGLFFLTFHFLDKRRIRLIFLSLPFGLIFFTNTFYQRLEELTIKASYIGTKIDIKNIFNQRDHLNFLNLFGKLERIKTPYQVIDFFTGEYIEDFSTEKTSTLYLNRKTQFNNFTSDVYHQTMIHAGINLSKTQPKKILILGGGDGVLLSEATQNIPDSRITMVELDQKMVEWSKSNSIMRELNKGIYQRITKNTEIYFDDAITFLRKNRRKYNFDLIFIDFPFPNGHELSKLYSIEFYKLVISSLSNDGLAVIDLPINTDKEDNLTQETLTILSTIYQSGFKYMIGFGPHSNFLAVSKSNELQFDYKKLPKDISLSAKINFSTIIDNKEIKEKIKNINTNSMFWPRGL